MKNLNEKSTEIFCRLMDNMTDHDCLVIENEPYMNLKLEKIHSKINLSAIPNHRFAPVYRLLQSYTDLDGTEITEPEMHFLVIGYDRSTQRGKSPVLIIPFHYHHTNTGTKETSMLFHEKRMPTKNPYKQAKHAQIADKWLQEIYEQGFLDACIY